MRHIPKLVSLLEEAGYQVKVIAEEQCRDTTDTSGSLRQADKPFYKITGDILLRISPKGSDESGIMVVSGSGVPQKTGHSE